MNAENISIHKSPLSLEDYRDRGFIGIDASLEISLYEYGLIYNPEPNEDGSYDFVFGTNYGLEDEEYKSFSSGSLNPDELLEEDWIDLEDVAMVAGHTVTDWMKKTFLYQVDALVSYYGWINVFGDAAYRMKIEREKETK